MLGSENPDRPLVSVIIPTYNRAAWLVAAVESVLAQSYSNFELLVIDDGSIDNTREVVTRYAEKVRYIYQSNRGPAAARNRGLQEAHGDYIAFLDSDDRWLKHKLREQVALVTSDPSLKICYTDEIWIRHGRRVNQKKIHRKYSGWIYQRCLPLCIISPSSVMIQREVLAMVGGFDESFPVCEDYELWLRISRVYPIAFIAKPLIIKTGGHPDQLSHQYWGLDRFRVAALVKILDSALLARDDRRATITTLRQKCQILVQGFSKRGKLDESQYYRSLAEKYAAELVEEIY